MIGQAFEENRGKYETPQKETIGRDARDRAGFVNIEPAPKNVGTELVELRDGLTKAHELFSVLEDRTRPMRFPTPQCPQKERETICGGSELRGALSEQNDRLRSLVNRIASMIDEIDL